MHSVLLWNESVQNEHSKNAGASSSLSAVAAGNSHSSQWALKF